MGMGIDVRNRVARRAAEEIEAGMVVNLGIGIPSLVPDFLGDGSKVMFHAENGVVGMGPSPVKGQENHNLCNAGGFPVTLREGGSYCDSATAFAMIRRGKIDATILGALQVSAKGDLANWIVPGKKVPGMGGAMDLAQKAKKVIVVMSHCDKQGKPKIVEECTLPLTSKRCVDLIITEKAVFNVTECALVLQELFPPFDVSDVLDTTACEVKIAADIRRISY